MSGRGFLQASNWSRSAPCQVAKCEEYVDIGMGPWALLAACSTGRRQTQAQAAMKAWGPIHVTHACEGSSGDPGFVAVVMLYHRVMMPRHVAACLGIMIRL